jgi:hypothetical protein
LNLHLFIRVVGPLIFRLWFLLSAAIKNDHGVIVVVLRQNLHFGF